MEIVYYLLGFIFSITVVAIFIYNKIVSLNIRCKNGWASIDNQLKRRSDLIPNLVEITKGYAQYESETLLKVVEARNTSIAEIGKQSKKISAGVSKLLALSEAYPELKADKLFLNLQVELTGTEDKIAYARQFYNDSVQYYNTTIMMFPNNILANMLKYKEKEYFQINESDRENVSVKL